MSSVAWHNQEVEDVLDALEAMSSGLSDSDVRERLHEYGKNTLPEPKKRSWAKIFIEQFTSPLMLILFVAALLSVSLHEWLDAGVILLALFLNAGLGFVEEFKADRSLEALKSYLPKQARVRRAGDVRLIDSKDLVPGDILLLAAGDKVTADARLIEEHVLEASEAALTGESSSVQKSIQVTEQRAGVGDRTNCVFAGTTIVAGRGVAIVYATGVHTEIGKISASVAAIPEEKTPLQRQMRAFARYLGIGITFFGTLIVLIGVYRGLELVDGIQLAVAIAVSAVPEGLAVAVTVILAIGMQRILKKNALVRRLVAAETLGSVSVICMDKTGTLTTGEMTVVEVQALGSSTAVPEGSVLMNAVKTALRATSGVEKEVNEDGGVELHGNPTDIALFSFSEDISSAKMHRLSEIPFDSRNKYAARIVEMNGEKRTYVAGAPDVLSRKADLSDRDRVHLEGQVKAMTKRGLRVILVGSVPHVKGDQLAHEDLRDIEVLGLVGMHDPLRPETADVIEDARKAGIVPVMITGDHPETALRIAQAAGLAGKDARVMRGEELDAFSDAELAGRVPDIQVFARVAPRHKLRIVSAWQSRGASVAMIGDGVNDAPALKAADIGVVVGSGTEVAKETADMVLLDNRFASIVLAIREGRIIFDNIRKMIVYLVSDSFSELILIMGALILGLPLPILPLQILWINLVTDGFPSLALTFEPGEKGVMREPPRKVNEPIVNTEMKMLIFLVGILTDFLLFGLYFYLLQEEASIDTIRTLIFLALGVDSLIYVFAVRTFRTSIFRSHPFKNKWLLAGVGVGFLFLLAPLYIAPLQAAFAFTEVPRWIWGTVIGLSLVQLILIEVVKEVFHLKRRRATITAT